MPALVSVIIPLYNAEEFIAETINSVLAQTYKNIEIIIINDGSTDKSLEKVLSIFDNRITVLNQENKGASAARNNGLTHAKGQYIQFLDADDLISENKIEEQIKVLEKHPNSIVSCRYVKFQKNINHTIGPVGPHPLLSKNLAPLDWLLANHTMLIHAWLTPKHIIDKAGYWDEKLSFNDDGEYFARVISYAQDVIFYEKLTVYYRVDNPNSISKINSKSKMISAFNAVESFEETISKLSITNKEYQINSTIGNKYKNLLFIAYANYPELYQKFGNHCSLKYANIKYNAGGKLFKLLNNLLGWKVTIRIKLFLKSL